MALQSSWNIPSGNPYGAVTTAAMGMPAAATTKKKIDWQKLAPVLAQALGVLAAGLVGGKDYGGIAAGSAAQTLGQFMQQQEERKLREAEMEELRKQRELEQQIQEWELNLKKEAAEKERQRQEALEKWFGSVEEQLGTLAQPTSPWTVAGEAITTPELKLQGTFGEPKDQWLLTTPAPVEATYVPSIPGDVFAEQLLKRIKAAGGLANLPEEIVSEIEKYVWEKTLPKEPEPYVSGEPYIGFQVGLHPLNPYKGMAPNVFADPKAREEARQWDETLRRLYPEETAAPPKRSRELFEKFSPNNRFAQYALTHYDAMTNKELDDYYDKAVAEETKLKEAAKGGGGASTPLEYKKYYGTPFVQQWKEAYEQYLRQAGETDIEAILSGQKEPQKAKTFEQWMRSQPNGDKLWAQYVKESGILGDQFYATNAGQLIVKYGGVARAILKAGLDPTVPIELIDELVTRYNKQHGTNYTRADWAEAARLGLAGPHQLPKYRKKK